MPIAPFTTLPAPFYEGLAAATDQVPVLYPAALAGRGIFLDLAQFQFQTTALQRPSMDQGSEAGGQSRATEGIWLRHQVDWSHGAGQRHFDWPTSDRARFHASKGVDVWTPGALSLLPDVEVADAASASNLQLVAAGGKLWKMEGATLAYSANGTSWTGVTLTGVGTLSGLCSDGLYVYVCDGANIWQGLATGVSGFGAAFSTVDATQVWFANGRLFAAVGNLLQEIGAGGAGTTVATLRTGFTWNAVTGALNGTYAAATAGTLSELYYLGVNTSTGALLSAVAATPWPIGETINVLGFYAGFLCIGTSLGLRLASIDGSNFVAYGQAIEVTGGVNVLAFESKYLWFGWTNYDSVSTGVGRLNLGEVVDATQLLFAYATDLMATTQGTVAGLARFGANTYFGVAGHGVYRGASTLVAAGTLTAGQVSFNDVERKVFVGIRLEHQPLAGSVDILGLDPDGGDQGGGTSNAVGSTRSLQLGLGNARVTWLEPELTLTRSATATSTGPAVTLWQIRAIPVGTRPESIVLPIHVGKSVENRLYDPFAMRAWLRDLQRSGVPVLLQLGTETLTVLIDWIAMQKADRWDTVDTHAGLAGVIHVRVLTLET